MLIGDERRIRCSNFTHGYVDPSWPNPFGESDACFIPYGSVAYTLLPAARTVDILTTLCSYVPSFALCIAAIVLFTAAVPIHLLLIVKHRSWYFVSFLAGLVLEVAGYVPRALSSKVDPYSSTFFVLQYFFIVIAPLGFSAALYAVLSVAISRVGRQYAPIPPLLILGAFVAADVAATVLQVFQTAGAAAVGDPDSPYGQGQAGGPSKLLLAGLATQVASFGAFVFCLCWFAVKSRHATPPPIKKFLAALLVSTLAVYLRTCFRLAETAQTLSSSLATNETLFAVLEFLPIILAVYILTYWHPGRWLTLKMRSAEVIDQRVPLQNVQRKNLYREIHSAASC